MKNTNDKKFNMGCWVCSSLACLRGAVKEILLSKCFLIFIEIRQFAPFYLLPIAYCLLPTAYCQPILDGIVAVVGNSPILKSEIESKQIQAKLDSVKFDPCKVLEELLYQKLLLTQAIRDSIEITNEQVEEELDRRLRYYISQFGSVKAFEEFYGKSVEKFKDEFKDELREVLLVQRMQQQIAGNITVSPAEVRAYFESIPKDSIPFINAEIEVGHIMKVAKIHPDLKKYAKEKLESIREEIVSGKKDFATSAILHSMDPGSASNGGLYKNVQRGTFVPEFDAVAFRMKEKEVSDVFETDFGYHILMVESRRGDEIDVRHILIVPQPSSEDLFKAKMFLDSIANLIRKDSLSLTEAASRFSDDEETKLRGGIIANPSTGNTHFEMSELSQIDPNLALTISKLNVGEISSPILTQSREGKPAYHILFVKSRTKPHRANLKDDYQRIQEEALFDKKNRIIKNWIEKKIATTHIHIGEEYKNCPFNNKWIQ